MRQQLLYILLMALFCTACHRVKPQAPANRPPADEQALAATLANMHLAEAADKACTDWVKRSGLPFVQHPEGFWYLITQRNGTDSIHAGEAVNLHYITYLPDSTMLQDVQRQVHVGKRETLPALDKLLPELLTGQQVTILTPYYNAYADDAHEVVPHYSCCRIVVDNIDK